jgi:AAA domain-containing protein
MARVERDLVNHVLAALPVRLSDEQVAAVRAIATSGSGIEVVEALAGTGKTSCWRAGSGLSAGGASRDRGRADRPGGT